MSLASIFQGAGLRVLALAAATVIWLGVSSERREQRIERSFAVPVALVGVPRDVVVMTPVAETVSVRLRGPVRTLRELSSKSLEVAIDLRDSKPGSLRAPIRPQSFNLPANVEVVSIAPAAVTFKLEALRNKQVTIQPFFVGELPQGYSYAPDEVKIGPPTALVSGPATTIRSLESVFTDRVVLSGRTAPFRQTVGIVSDIPLVNVIEPQSAVIDVPVYPPTPEELERKNAGPKSGKGSSTKPREKKP